MNGPAIFFFDFVLSVTATVDYKFPDSREQSRELSKYHIEIAVITIPGEVPIGSTNCFGW